MSRIANLLRPVPDLMATGRKIKSLMDASGISARDLQELLGRRRFTLGLTVGTFLRWTTFLLWLKFLMLRLMKSFSGNL